MSVPYFLFTYMHVKACTADVPCTDGISLAFFKNTSKTCMSMVVYTVQSLYTKKRKCYRKADHLPVP